MERKNFMNAEILFCFLSKALSIVDHQTISLSLFLLLLWKQGFTVLPRLALSSFANTGWP